MPNDGKALERLVATVESLHLPEGSVVTRNRVILDDDGNQIAELDIEVVGKLGSTEMRWLIECRDRPSAGAAPISWIEQLVARRSRLGYHKVTAVSTTGFAPAAREYAHQEGIELREVSAREPEAFSRWLASKVMIRRENQWRFSGAIRMIIGEDESAEMKIRAEQFIGQSNALAAILGSAANGERFSVQDLFTRLMNTPTGDALFAEVKQTGEWRRALLRFIPDSTEQHFLYVQNTPVRIRGVIAESEVRVLETLIPLAWASEYSGSESGTSISQSAAFEFSAWDKKLALEIHNIASTGETSLMLRVLE